jgi:hypothetical protein
LNAWKQTEAAGRVFTVGTEGTVDTVVTGLAWRREVCQQVFEEAAVDLGKGLKAAHRQTHRFSPIQEENQHDPVVSAAQQTPQGPPAGDPGR